MTILIAVVVFALAVLLLSLGVLLSGRRIQGSCGGLSNIPGIESDCGGLCRTQGGKPKKGTCHRRSMSSPADGHDSSSFARRWTSNGNT